VRLACHPALVVALAAVLVVATDVGIGWWAWRGTRNLVDPELAKAQMDAIRTSRTAAGGTGAALALLLVVRRQRSTEAAAPILVSCSARACAASCSVWVRT
jgi:hypothetical protein